MSATGRDQRVSTSQDSRISAWPLFGLVYATSISSVYFALGVVAHHADGLTPEVFVLAAAFFQLTAMTYLEGATLHPERGGAAIFARYAFNELVSFVAGWAIFLDYVILVAVAALTAPAYLAVFWPALGHGTGQLIGALVIVALVTADSLTGIDGRALRRRVMATGADLLLQAIVVVLGLVLVFHPSRLTAAVHVGTAPHVSDLLFALPIGVIAFAGLESAASMASEAVLGRRQVKRLLGPGSLAIALVYVGISVVGVAVLPIHHGLTELGQRNLDAPVLGIVQSFRPRGFADVLKYLVGIGGGLGLLAAAGAAMLGVSRVGYSLATNRQIPSAVGRLSARFGTPWVVISAAALAAAALVLPHDLELLVAIYAFGAMTAFLIAHLSVITMRFRDPGHDRPYRVPLSVPIRGAAVPLPAVLGALMAAGGWIALLVFHRDARYVGAGWLLAGVALYVIYRRASGQPVLRRVVIPERALRQAVREVEFGSILVPISGSVLDESAVAVAGRLAGGRHEDSERRGAIIEAIYVLPIPMQLPLDGPVAPDRLQAARAALTRAKDVGERYQEVEVATAVVRARRVGAGIVQEARRRGVEAIVLAADSADHKGETQRSGKFGGDVKYVLEKAPCRVILTAPAIDRDVPADG